MGVYMSEAEKLVEELFHAYENFALGDVDRAMKGQSMLGALVLAACFIDYMANLRGVTIGSMGRGRQQEKL